MSEVLKSGPGLQDQTPTATTAGKSTTTGSPQDTQTRLTWDENLKIVSCGERGNLNTLESAELHLIQKALQKQRSEYSRRLVSLDSGLNHILEEFWKRNFGITLGCFVQVNGKKFKVTRIEHRSWDESNDKPGVKGVEIMKDGTLGVRDKRLFRDWEVVK